MCIIRQHCSICEKHFDRFSKNCPSECPQHAEATSYEHSQYLDKENGWCQATGIVCYKCSKMTDAEPTRPKIKARQAGAWRRMLRAKLMVKKREAEEARLAEKKRLEAEEAKAKAKEKAEEAEVWRKKVEELVVFSMEGEVKNGEE